MSKDHFKNWESGLGSTESGGGVSDHGELEGLGDDDHSQYLNNLRHDTTDRHTLGDVVPVPDLDDLGDVDVSSPDDGDVLTFDSVLQEWIAETLPGGGGGSTNLFYPEFTTPPALSNWTWVNQGTAEAKDTDQGIALYAPNVGGDQLRILVRDIPTAPYTLTAFMNISHFNYNFNQAGLILYESGSGKAITMLLSQAGLTIALNKWTSVSAYNSVYGQYNIAAPGSFVWFRLTDDETNRGFWFSTNGVYWHQIYSVSRTDYITPDKIGIYCDSNNAIYSVSLHLLSWKEE
jgi:hypothetical protein